MENWWETRSAMPADMFSGHRKITFEAEEDTAPFVFGGAIDLVLLADNRIVASTAANGRYAAGSLFFARDEHRYAELYEACSTDITPYAFLHVRSVAMVSGAFLTDSGLLLAMVIHGNTKRTLRVLSHGLPHQIRLPQADIAAIGGLRHDDEPVYQQLCGANRQLCILMRGVGRALEIASHAALTSLLQERVRSLWTMLGLPIPELLPQDLPFPSVGQIHITRTSAILLCLGLWLSRRKAAGHREEMMTLREDAAQLSPCFCFSISSGESVAMAAGEMPIELITAAHLAEFDETVFTCEVQPDMAHLWVRFSPLCPSRPGLYALRSLPPWLFS